MGWSWYIEQVASSRHYIDYSARRFGSHALKVGKELRIVYERESAVIMKEVKDPSSEEIFATKRENASQLAAKAFTIIKRAAWNRPLVAYILQRRRAIFNERLNFWLQ